MAKDTKKQMTVGIAISYLVIIVQFFTGLLYTPIMLKSLGQSEYGVYSLCTSFMGYFTIMNGGINAAYIRFYVQMKEKKSQSIEKLNGIFLKIFIVIAFIALVGGLLTSYFSAYIFGGKISVKEYYLVEDSFKLLAISSALQILNCVFSSLIIAEEKFIVGKSVNLIVAILNPVVTIPLLERGYGCVMIIGVHLATTLISLLINVFYCRYSLNVKFDLFAHDRKLLTSIFVFSGFIVLQSIMDQVNWQIDKFILARTQGTGEISLYSVGSTFNKYFLMFSGALSGVFISKINKLQAHENIEGLNNIFVRSSRIFAYLIWFFISGYTIFGQQFVIRWAGAEYKNSYIIGLFLMLPVTASLTMGLGQDIARAMNKHKAQILINVVICLVNFAISIPLAIKWGAVGSAGGTFFAEILMCMIVEPLYYYKVLGLDIRELFVNLKNIAGGMIIPIIVGVIILKGGFVKPNYLSIAMYAMVYALLYFVSMYIFAMNDYEKNYIKKIKNRIMKIWA